MAANATAKPVPIRFERIEESKKGQERSEHEELHQDAAARCAVLYRFEVVLEIDHSCRFRAELAFNVPRSRTMGKQLLRGTDDGLVGGAKLVARKMPRYVFLHGAENFFCAQTIAVG